VPRHLLDIQDLSCADVEELFALADAGPQPQALAGLTFLAAFFQESTRTRLGFLSAAACQGASVLDMGGAERLRLEPAADQQLVLGDLADIVSVRHGNATFVHDLAAQDRCGVINAGAGGDSHPTQALIDAYTLLQTFNGNLSGRHVVFLGPLLRSARSFRALGAMLGVVVSQCDVTEPAELEAADVIYVQSLSATDYTGPGLNAAPRGPALPASTIEAIGASDAFLMHALPRGPELPDSLMATDRSLVAAQLHHGLPMRSAVLRWLMQV
jgi:aspartate carbamoyltransferase catalytic subunit